MGNTDQPGDTGDAAKPTGHVFHAEPAEFSRTNADWLTLAHWEQIEEGDATAASILREECERRGEPPPTDDEIEAFDASHRENVAKLSDTLRSAGVAAMEHLRSSLNDLSTIATQANESWRPVFGETSAVLPNVSDLIRQNAVSPLGKYEPPERVDFDFDLLPENTAVVEAVSTGLDRVAATLAVLVAHAERAVEDAKADRRWFRRTTRVMLLLAAVAAVTGVITVIG